MSQFTSIRYGERLAEIGAVPSIGTVGDSFDNALAEAVNALYKTELIRGPGQVPRAPSRTSSSPPSGGSHWHNNERLHGYLDDVPPVRVRGGLRCPTDRPGTGWNPITRASIETQGESPSHSSVHIGLRFNWS